MQNYLQKSFKSIDKNGWYKCEFNFNDYIPSITSYLETLRCIPSHSWIDQFKKNLKLEKRKNINRDHFNCYPRDINTIMCPHLLNILNDHRLIKIAQKILNDKVILAGFNIWWSNPKEKFNKITQQLHRDPPLFSSKRIKVFVYLTDVVDDSHGPHFYIGKTHKLFTFIKYVSFQYLKRNKFKSNPLGHLIKIFKFIKGTIVGDGNNYPIEEKIKSFTDENNNIKFYGKAGSIFITNPSGLHKGLVPKIKPRLIMSFTYISAKTKNKINDNQYMINIKKDILNKLCNNKDVNFEERNCLILKGIK